MKIHPIAARFPVFSEEELEALAQDIKKNKQRLPIMLSPDGTMIVDGVNRYNACKLAGVKPKFKRLPKSYDESDIVQYIVSINLRRRDLNPGQRAMLAVELIPAIEAAAKKRVIESARRHITELNAERKAGKQKRSQPRTSATRRGKRANRTDVAVAKIAHTGSTSVYHAKVIKEHSKNLAEKVISGEVSINDAYKTARREQAAAPKPDDGAPSKTTTVVITHTGKKSDYALPKSAPRFNETNDQVGWAMWTWNPVTGCLHNCPYCYAREGTEVNPNLSKHYPFGFEPTFFEFRLRAPANTRIPLEAKKDPRFGRVFVSSMGDLFGKWVPDEWIERVFESCINAPWWEYLFLTKFPQRYVGMKLPPTAWIGTTVDTQDRVKIAETAFRKIDGVRVKWLSCEPLLEPLQFTDLSMFDFVVIGSQSSTNQPDGKGGSVRVSDFKPEFKWVADLTYKAWEAGCRVYHKPNLLGIPNDQCTGMKLVQEVPILKPLPWRTEQGEMFEAAE